MPLAVSTPKRASVLPDVPTTLEAGFADSDYTFWIGLFAPAKTPAAIVDKLHQQAHKALQAAGVRDRLATLGVEPMVMSAAELDALVKAEIAVNAAVIKAANIKAE